jgi:hypothetical protein
MRQPSDWRLMGQERYLKGVTLVHRSYHPANPTNDHDHCEFCKAKFLELVGPDVLRIGYTTLDGYRWICEICYGDFVDLFEWKIGSET